MHTTDPYVGQHFFAEEIQAVGEMVASLPFGGTAWTLLRDHEAIPELISITPPGCKGEDWWHVWKRLDGRIMVDSARPNAELGNYDTLSDEYEQFEDALAVISEELIEGKRHNFRSTSW
jgi:hypothetical protein